MRLARVAALGIIAVLLIACGSQIPSIAPTPGPGASVDPGVGMCRLLSAAEVGAVVGATVTVTDSQADKCTYTSPQTFATINVRTESGDLAEARFLLGDTATDVTINGMAGLSGTFDNNPLVYVQRGDQELVVQGVLLGADEAAMAKVVQLATTAASRW